MLLSTGQFFGASGGAVTPSGDPHFANVVLLTAFDGVDGATTATDDSNSAHSPTFINSAQIDTAQSMFGGASLLLASATSDRVDIPDSADWHFGSGDFTIEAFIRFSNLTGFQTIISQWASGQQSWQFDFPGSANNLLRFGYSTNGSNSTFIQGAASSFVPSLGTWYHVCAERSGTTLRLYAGAAGGSASVVGSGTIGTDVLHNSTSGVRVGATVSAAVNTNFFKGWVDELRITKGVARYNSGSGYVVPTEAFLRS